MALNEGGKCSGAICLFLLCCLAHCLVTTEAAISNRANNKALASTAAPRFLSRGHTYRAVVGDTLVLPCEVENLGGLVLLWRRGTNVLTASQLMVTRDERIRLTDGYNLEIAELEPQDAGDYVCQISDKQNKDQVHTVEIMELNKYLLAFFCIWILTSKHFQPTTIMAMPVHMSSEYNKHPKSLSTLKLFLTNPCGFDAQTSGSDSTDSRSQATYELENKDVKFYLGKIESSARTGLSDFKTGYLKNFLLTDFSIPHATSEEGLVGHHEAWKHQSNPNLLPNGKHLDIEFLKDLSDEAKLFAEASAQKFDVANDDDKQQLLTILEDCDERLQRLLVVFYQMHQNLDNFKINFRQDDFATDNIRKVYAKAMDIIRNGLCDVRTATHKLYQISGISGQPARIVDVEYILNNPFKTDSIGDWVNVRQLHDQLEYMTRFFGIWVNEIQETK